MEEAELINRAKVVGLPKDAAGHKMTSKVPLIHSDQKIADARNLIENNTSNYDSINYLYVVSKSQKLKGVISIKDIFRHKPDTLVSQVMSTKIIKAHPDSDQEKVAQEAVKNNLKAVPLVDRENTLVGVLTSDTILSILDSESRDDLLRLSGIILGRKRIDSEESGVGHAFIYRIPWIIIGLFGGLMTAKVIGGFEDVLSQNIILASFIPLVAYIANAVGAQTQTLYIRDLATKPKFSFPAYMVRQVFVSTLIGLTVWVTILGLSMILWQSLQLGIIVGFSLFLAILVATVFALLIPRALDQFDVDPANGSGPFATIVQDLLSVLIYLSVANLFF